MVAVEQNSHLPPLSCDIQVTHRKISFSKHQAMTIQAYFFLPTTRTLLKLNLFEHPARKKVLRLSYVSLMVAIKNNRASKDVRKSADAKGNYQCNGYRLCLDTHISQWISCIWTFISVYIWGRILPNSGIKQYFQSST